MNPAFNGELPRINGVYAIKQDLGKTLGKNLFHSFAKFDLAAGETADFQGSSIINIISRVTGGTKSHIDGTIKSSVSGANLYLMNPNGVMFGPNASLDLSGSFHVTTADYLKFSETEHFSADKKQTSHLVAVDPVAFGFLNSKPSTILFNGAGSVNSVSSGLKGMTVPAGKTFSVTGGDITVQEGLFSNTKMGETILKASGGRLLLISTGGPGEVIPDGSNPSLGYGQSGGTINLVQRSALQTSGDVAGTVYIRGKDVSITGGAYVSSRSDKSGFGGGIDIRVQGNVTVDGKADTISSGVYTNNKSGAGSGLKILVEGKNILISNTGSVFAMTNTESRGGDIIMNGEESITISASGPIGGIAAGSFSIGSAGDISLKAPRIELLNGGIVYNNSFGTGSSGNIEITASSGVFLKGLEVQSGLSSYISSDTLSSTGNAGNITITTGMLQLQNGAQITSQANLSKGNSGHINITSSGDVSLSGWSKNQIPAHISNLSYNMSGDITVYAHNLTVLDGGQITASSFKSYGGKIKIDVSEKISVSGHHGIAWFSMIDASSGGMNAMTNQEGKGSIWLQAENIELTDGGVIHSNLVGSGMAGNIYLNATNGITLDGNGIFDDASSVFLPARILSDFGSEGAPYGQAGRVFLNASSIFIRNGAYISSSSIGKGDAGKIEITASQLLDISGVSNSPIEFLSRISSSSYSTAEGAGKGGEIWISTPLLTLGSENYIRAGTLGPGDGGDIVIHALDRIMMATSSSISTNSLGMDVDAGVGGAITITTKYLALDKNSKINTSSAGSGKAGNIINTLTDLTLTGGSIASSNNGNGDAGSITVRASERVDLSQKSVITTGAKSGQGGHITVTTSTLSGTDGSTISASVQGGSGRGGNVNLYVHTMSLSNGSLVESSTAGEGGGGSIKMEANSLRLDSGSAIAANSSSGADKAGQAGSIQLASKDHLILHGSAITSSSEKGGGGDITVQVNNRILLAQSSISTSVKGGDGKGGNIFIDPIHLILKDSQIQANAFQGAGGKVIIQAHSLLKNPSSAITASSAQGIQGTVTLDTPNVNPADSLSALPVTFFDASSLMSERCSSRRGNRGSSFVIKGRGALPLMPGDLLASHGVAPHDPAAAKGDESDSFGMVNRLENELMFSCLM
ncbi:MAG: filamentous hemagglutinin N-terminal domain-containing protein [Magnetococcus sp. YQC-5]